MISDQFLTFARVLPDPLLLVTSEAKILAVNQAAAKILNQTSKTLVGQHLTQFVTDSPEKVIDYLRACSQSRQMILGALTICPDQEQEIVYRSRGSVIQPRSPDSPAINLLRLEKRTNSEFVLLNQKIHALKQEVQQRQWTQLELARSNETLKQTLLKLQNALEAVQTEKMSGLGQLVAGIAHEINNPISFIHGNLTHASEYYDDLLKIIHLYQQEYPHPSPVIQQEVAAIDLDFVQTDIQQLLRSMRTGSQRISEVVKSLRNFSRLGESTSKVVDIHEGLEATLMILQNRLTANDRQAEIKVIKNYGELPWIYCSPGSLNQVFMNLLNNAIDALQDQQIVRKTLKIWTESIQDTSVAIHIIDNGCGIREETRSQIFDPFFTTKPIGQGTGLGLSIAYQIVTEQHSGRLYCHSLVGKGTEFVVELPILSQPGY